MRHTIIVPQDPGGGTRLPDLETKDFIKEMTFEAGFEERVEIVQVRKRPEGTGSPGLLSPWTAGSCLSLPTSLGG